MLDPRVGNATRVLLLRPWLSSIVRTRLGEPNLWSGRALQEGSFELAELRPDDEGARCPTRAAAFTYKRAARSRRPCSCPAGIPCAAVEQAWALPEVVPGSRRRPLVRLALPRQAAPPDLRPGLVVLWASHRLREVATVRP